MILNNQRGQSSIEAAVMSVVLVIFLAFLSTTLYMVYASYWAEHILYESLICYQERGNKNICSQIAVDKMKSTLFLTRSYSFKMDGSKTLTRSTMQLEMYLPFVEKKVLKFTKSIRV